MFKMKSRKGFTLVELIIVMVILGALAAIAIPKMGGSTEGARLASIKSDMRMAVAKANEQYSKALDYSTVGNLTSSGSHADKLTPSPGNIITVAPVSGDNGNFTVSVTRTGASDCTAGALYYNSATGFSATSGGTATAAIPTISCTATTN